jgi:hypothetical protein
MVVVSIAALPAWAAKNRSKKAGEEAFAVIAGTVFRSPGFAVAEAEVIITPEVASGTDAKLKKIKVLTDRRGEFAAHVPAVPMRYNVDVQITGHEPQQKAVSIEGEQRKDVYFLLEPSSK